MYKGCQTFALWWEANWRPIEMKLKLQRCLGFRGSFGPCSTLKDKGSFYFWKQCTRCEPLAMSGHAGAGKSCSIGNLQEASMLRHRHRNDKTTSHWTGFYSGDDVKDGKHHWNELTKMKQMNKWAGSLWWWFQDISRQCACVPNAKFSMSLPVLGS